MLGQNGVLRFAGSKGSKGRFAKAAGVEVPGDMADQNMHPAVARERSGSQNR